MPCNTVAVPAREFRVLGKGGDGPTGWNRTQTRPPRIAAGSTPGMEPWKPCPRPGYPVPPERASWSDFRGPAQARPAPCLPKGGGIGAIVPIPPENIPNRPGQLYGTGGGVRDNPAVGNLQLSLDYRGGGRAPTMANALPDVSAARNCGLPAVNRVNASISVSSLAVCSAGGEGADDLAVSVSDSAVITLRRFLRRCRCLAIIIDRLRQRTIADLLGGQCDFPLTAKLFTDSLRVVCALCAVPLRPGAGGEALGNVPENKDEQNKDG
jgi:hypothetical protein